MPRDCRCRLDPCACDYLDTLKVGGRNEWLRPVVLAANTQPLPHRPACPCPGCYSTRLATWETA